MKKEEEIVSEYLRLKNRQQIYEPDGKVPPDFLFDNEIAVEVRRLNQNYFQSNKVKGLEQDSYKISNHFKAIFKQFDNQEFDKGYLVIFRYNRPIGNIRILRKTLFEKLKYFLSLKPKTPFHINISNNVEITIVESDFKLESLFEIGGEVDFNSPGVVASIYIENINFCILEKTEKIKNCFSKYNIWHLILVDYIGDIVELQNDQYGVITENIKKGSLWDKVIVLNPFTKKEILII